MKGTGLRMVLGAAGDRLWGEGPGPLRALLAAAVTGSATAALTYHLLRGGDGDS
jgi:hypothetical protein